MWVFTQKTKHVFFIHEAQTDDESLGANGRSMVSAVQVPAQPMAGSGQGGQKQQKLKQTRRGKCKKRNSGKSMKSKSVNFTILGSNANGIKAKVDSLKSIINTFDNPSCVTIQESKLRKPGTIQLKGYQIFELNRSGFGGGLLTAVDEQLLPVLVTVDDQVELLVVQVRVGEMDIKFPHIINAEESKFQKERKSRLNNVIFRAP